VASGKTLVARIWADTGVPVILADELAREVVEPGSEGLAEIVAVFGEEVLREDGTLHREALGERVFQRAEERKTLEGILHPRIQLLREAWMSRQREAGSPLAVSEIPLLFEGGLEQDFDAVVLVDAPREERLRRLTDDRGLAIERAEAVMDVQMPAREKRARADFVLDNGGSREELKERALALLDLLRARARRRGPA
jgi:dephospho-CoA kinase